jgi:tetratricopeptide (TPR) repeat protein
METGDLFKAQEHFEKAKKYIDPSVPDGFFLMYISVIIFNINKAENVKGRMLESNGQFAEAKSFYDQYSQSKDYRPHYIEDAKRRVAGLKEIEVTAEVSPEEDPENSVPILCE